MKVAADANIFLYYLGAEHPNKESCAMVVAAARAGLIDLQLSVEAIQEVVFHRMRVGNRLSAINTGRDLLSAVDCHDFTIDIMRDAMNLSQKHHIRGRDAVHAATALAHGCEVFVTTDRDFAQVPGLEVLTPEELLERLESAES
jgi:predicted nucleic acid-binding protein